MERIDGSPDPAVACPPRGPPRPRPTAGRSRSSIDALVAIHAVDWRACGLGDLAHAGDVPRPPARRAGSASSTPTAGASCRPRADVADWLDAHRPPDQPSRRCATATTSSTTCCSRPTPPPRLLAVVDWEMAAIGDPLVDLAWALIFHPGPGGHHAASAWRRNRRSRSSACPDRRQLVERYAARVRTRHGRDRLVRRVRPLEAGDRARGQLRQVPARPVRTSRSTSSSGRRPTCCSHSATRSSIDAEETVGAMMRAWQVQGAGRADRRAARGRARPARARAGPGADPGDRRRHRAARRVHVPRHLPADAPAAVHAGPGGDRRRSPRSATASTSPIGTPGHVRDRVLRTGHGSFAEECLVAGRLGLPGPRRSHRRRGRRLLDPAPHRRGSVWSTGAASPPASGWPCSAPPAGAASPRCSSGGRSARGSSPS